MKKYFNRIIFAMVLIFTCNIILTGCGKEKEENSLSVAIGGEPTSLDPALTETSDSTGAYVSHLFQPLVELDENGKIIAGVAEKWSGNEDNTEFTFELRKDAKWSDGKEVTANDFKYAWLRVLNPETASMWAQHLYYLKNGQAYNEGSVDSEEVGITVVNDYELKVELKNPCVFFLNMVTLQPYYPIRQDIIEKYGDTWTNESKSYIGNGAYVLDEWKHNSYISMSKNDKYWDKDNIKIDNLKFSLLIDASAALNAYEAGEIDYLENLIPAQELERLKSSENYYSIPLTVTKFLCFNLKSDVLKNEKVREAISVALDREAMVSLLGNGAPLKSFLPLGFYNSVEEVDFLEDSNSVEYISSTADIEKCKSLLKEAGFEKEEDYPVIEFATNDSSANQAIAEIVQQQLAKAGITVKINSMEKSAFNEYRAAKKYDMCVGGWWAEYPDPTSFLYLFRSTDMNNCFNFADSKVDDLYEKITVENDLGARYQMLHELEKEVMEQYVTAPLYSMNLDAVSSKKISHIVHNTSVYVNFNNAEIE